MRTVYRYLNKLHRRQKGQAIAALLILLAFGGVTVAASLNFTTTTLKANGVVRDKTNGIYAASAGINMAVWELEHGGVVPDTLDESLNGMTVDIDDIDHGIFLNSVLDKRISNAIRINAASAKGRKSSLYSTYRTDSISLFSILSMSW